MTSGARQEIERVGTLATRFTVEVGTAEELIEVDRYGWKRYGNADFPDDGRFALLRLVRAIAADATTVEHVAQLVAAEYHGLTTDRSRYSYRLKRYYVELARRLPTRGAAAPEPSR